MSASSQNYSNHVRRHPLYHFVFLPLVAIYLALAIWRMAVEPGWGSAQHLLLAVIMVFATFLIRIYPLRAQDRTIRLEERLRYERVLPPDLAARAHNLRRAQIIALRFASDEELPRLIEQVLGGKLSTPKEIKQAIKDWRADHFRI